MDDQALDTLVEGFLDDPLYRWLYTDELRPAALRANMRLTLRLAREVGHLEVAPGGAGVAIWTNPGVPLLDDPAPFVDLLSRWAPERMDAALAGMAACARHVPSDAGTLHVIAVRPSDRGRGIGARLVTPWLEELDAHGHVGYLESSNPRNVTFYRRAGFAVLGQVDVSDGGPVMLPMTRPPAERHDGAPPPGGAS